MRSAVASVLGLGAAWSSLYAALAAGGHAPSSDRGLFVSADSYYQVAIILILPTVVLLWQILGRVSCVVGYRLGGRCGYPNVLAALGPAWALPILLLFIVPDFVVLGTLGFDALGPSMRYYAPLVPLVILAACTHRMAAATSLSYGRAFIAVLAGLMAQSIPAALLIR
ncbi:MAG: hypothetical protein ACI9WU_002879 [Myxococcota bacterium]